MHTHISVPPLSWAQLALHQLLVALAPLHELAVRAHVGNALLVDENDLRRLAHRAQGLRAWAFGRCNTSSICSCSKNSEGNTKSRRFLSLRGIRVQGCLRGVTAIKCAAHARAGHFIASASAAVVENPYPTCLYVPTSSTSRLKSHPPHSLTGSNDGKRAAAAPLQRLSAADDVSRAPRCPSQHGAREPLGAAQEPRAEGDDHVHDRHRGGERRWAAPRALR